MATESGMVIPPPPTLPDDDKDVKPTTTDNSDNAEPPRKRMKVDQPQVPHYNSHNIYSRPTTLPSSTQQQPTSLPTIHEPVTPLFEDSLDDNNNNNNNSNPAFICPEVAPLPEPLEKWPLCAYCGKSGDLSRCSSCRQAYYCNRECQVAHWDVHSIVCQAGPPQPPSLPDMSVGQTIPQPTTTYNHNNYNRSQGQYYNNGYPSHQPSHNNYGQHNGISHRSAHDYDPPPRPPRRRTYNNYTDSDGNKEQYYCEECDRYFKNGQALGGHRSRVHSSRRNGNHDPNLPPDHRAPRKRRPRASRARHEPSGNGQYVCPHCGREFRTGNALGGHISGAHTKKSKRMAARDDDHGRYARPRHPNI